MRNIQISTMSNGLRVVTDYIPTVESVSMGVWVRTGTRYEMPQDNGVAHLLEHMIFKGTKKRSAKEIAETIESVGGNINAYTSREMTAYYAKVLKADVNLAVDVLSDILQFSVFDNYELERERSVVLQEIGQANDIPDDVVFDNFQSTAFLDQPLGRPVLGKSDIVSKLSRDAVVSFRDKHYQAPQMVVAAAGNLNHEKFFDYVGLKFEALKNNQTSIIKESAYTSGEYRESRDLEQIHLILGFRSAAIGSHEFYGMTLLSNLLGGGMSSRLFQEIREKRGLVYSIDTFVSAFSEVGLFGIYAGTGPENITQLIPALCEELNRLPKNLKDKELNRAKKQLKSSLLMALESTGSRCEQLAQHLLLFDRVMPVEEMVKKIDSISLGEISELAGNLIISQPVLSAIGKLDNLESYNEITERLVA
ncbi:MAG: peptidase M16 [Rhodospirillaceae bacterium]|nr:peptidase M16 [Rhodospirillaceae bacterium]|tara:strand:+ start:8040 stop:9302 length:1263 start_codon:yes stop_codon:yes gene_type:complete